VVIQFLENGGFLNFLPYEIEHKSIENKGKVNCTNSYNIILAWRIFECGIIDYGQQISVATSHNQSFMNVFFVYLTSQIY
jgi:hypothetical protein